MITDLQGFSDADSISYSGVFQPHWFDPKDFMFCKINVDRMGSITVFYIFGDEYKHVKLTTFKEFIELFTKASHTFTVFDENELDACLNLHTSNKFKYQLATTGEAWDSETWCNFYWTKHKLNIRNGNKWWHVLDVSDLSRINAYKLCPLGSVEEIREFTLNFIKMAWQNGLVLSNNFTWSGIAQNFLMKRVEHSAWTKWKDPLELEFQTHFLQWNKGPHQGARVIGTFGGSDFDRIRSHLNILKDLPSHARWCTDYIKSTHFNPDALYANYKIECNLPRETFMPWRIRLDSDFTPEVCGEQLVVVFQPNLKAAIKVWGLKEGTDFKVIKSYQVVQKKSEPIMHPYRDACLKIQRLLEQKTLNEYHIKTIYQRFIGLMFHVLKDSQAETMRASQVFDPMIASTVWAEEQARCWETLMSSKDPQLMRVDGGTAVEPKISTELYTLGNYGTHLAFNHQLKDKVGETYYRDLISQNRDKAYLPGKTDVRLGFREAMYRDNLLPLNMVGKTITREVKLPPGDRSRKTPEIKRIGVLLNDKIISEVFTPEEAVEATRKRRELQNKLQKIVI